MNSAGPSPIEDLRVAWRSVDDNMDFWTFNSSGEWYQQASLLGFTDVVTTAFMDPSVRRGAFVSTNQFQFFDYISNTTVTQASPNLYTSDQVIWDVQNNVYITVADSYLKRVEYALTGDFVFTDVTGALSSHQSVGPLVGATNGFFAAYDGQKTVVFQNSTEIGSLTGTPIALNMLNDTVLVVTENKGYFRINRFYTNGEWWDSQVWQNLGKINATLTGISESGLFVWKNETEQVQSVRMCPSGTEYSNGACKVCAEGSGSLSF